MQKVCIKGIALIKTLTGLVNIFGCNIGSSRDAVQIFSPSTSSLLTISECSEADATKTTDLKRLLQQSLKSQPLEVFKKAMVRAKKASSVILMRAMETVETTFVCSFPSFEKIFSLDLGKVIVVQLFKSCYCDLLFIKILLYIIIWYDIALIPFDKFDNSILGCTPWKYRAVFEEEDSCFRIHFSKDTAPR